MFDVTKAAAELVATVRGLVEGVRAACDARLDLLEKRIAAIPAGMPGERGERGEKGADGVPGRDGTPGRDGKDGAPGPAGEKGADGIAGKNGAPGERGPQGERGADGAPGPKGDPGEKGADGRDGKDAVVDMAAIEAIVQMRVAERLDAAVAAAVERAVAAIPRPKDGAPGPKGDPGERGAPGERGPIGERGEKGIDGAPGRDGLPGRDGQPGAPGAMGEKGADGVDGRDGRDGWTPDDFDFEMAEDGRTLRCIARHAGGEVVREFHLAMPVYREVWRAGEYRKGDVVTYAGSMFHARRDTSQTPGTGDDWVLAVKRGRDGKDAPAKDGPGA